ncbi:MAG: hypothetical protein K5840_01325 [Eubacterium sp.]|nr:hypothetical protein [Eubacterium sp.]
MSPDTILFIHKDTKKEQTYEKILAQKYDLISWPITQRGLYRELPEVSLIFITVDDLNAAEYERLEDFLLVFPTSYIPLVIIGSKIFLKAFRTNVHYPAQDEIDCMKPDFNLIKSMDKIFARMQVKRNKRASELNNSEALLGIYSPVPAERGKYLSLFRKVCEAVAYDSHDTLLDRAISTSSPDTFLISYEAATENGSQLLRELRAIPQVANTPIILFGNPISQEAFKQLLTYRVNGYLVNTSRDDEIISIVTKQLKKPLAN